MKQTSYTLSPRWNDLLGSTLAQLLKQIPQCDDLKKLVQTTNALAKTMLTFSVSATPQLNAARSMMEELIDECSQIGLLISAARCIARIVKDIDPEWRPLLDSCCARLQTLLLQCDNIEEIIRTVNCIARLAPLVAQPNDDDDDDSEIDTPVNTPRKQKESTPIRKQCCDNRPNTISSLHPDSKPLPNSREDAGIPSLRHNY